MKREHRDYLLDIHDSIGKIEGFIKAYSFSRFAGDEKTQLAVVKSLEIIGEAVKKIPAKLKKDYPDIPWSKIAGMRDKLVHEYYGINIKVVWRTITEDLPPLKPVIADIISKILP